MFTAISYKALNAGSFNTFAAYAITLGAEISLYPKQQIIVLERCASDLAGKFIDSKALDFQINPIEVREDSFKEIVETEPVDVNTLKTVIHRMMEEAEVKDKELSEMTAKFKEAEKNSKQFSAYWQESVLRYSRMKSQIQALGTIVEGIVADK